MSSPPTTIAVREATVGPLSGTIEVSCGARSRPRRARRRAHRRRAAGRSSSCPGPSRSRRSGSRMRPSSVSSRLATDASLTSPEPVKPAPCQASARPMPDAVRAAIGPALAHGARLRVACGRTPMPPRRPRAPRSRRRSRAAPGRSASRRPRGRPSAGAGRAATASRASAMRLTCISAANSVCGAPKPRKAPLGGVLVAIARPVMRTFGHRYGPPAWSTPRLSTTGVSVQYAPPSMITSISWATSSPVPRDAGAVADDGRVTLGGGADVLVAVVDHAHRLAGTSAPAARRGGR